MTNQEIVEKLRTLIEQNLDVNLPEKITETDRVYEDLGIDSIMVLQLVVYVEEEFKVEIPEEDVDPAVFQTIGGLVNFIKGLQKK